MITLNNEAKEIFDTLEKLPKEEIIDYPISLELKTTDRGLKLLKSEMRVDGKKVGLKVAITNEACTWDTLKLNVVKSLNALENYRKEQLANKVKETLTNKTIEQPQEETAND